MLSFRLYMAQRISALLMVPFVIGHLVVMVYAIRGGISAEEILARTRNSYLWFAFYAMFVLAVSVHAAIGLRVIFAEWAGARHRYLDEIVLFVGLFLFLLGARAVWAVTFGAGVS